MTDSTFSKPDTTQIANIQAIPVPQAFSVLSSGPEGSSQDEVKRRLQYYGQKAITKVKRKPLWIWFFANFTHLTAILAELGDVEVYTIEIIPKLAESAATRLKDLGYAQVHLNQGDGYCGWAEYAPFNAIIVTAAPDHLPTPLTVQLAEGGRIVIPIGPPGCFQTLWKFVKKRGKLTAFHKGEVCFVPLTGLGIQAHQTKPTS